MSFESNNVSCSSEHERPTSLIGNSAIVYSIICSIGYVLSCKQESMDEITIKDIEHWLYTLRTCYLIDSQSFSELRKNTLKRVKQFILFLAFPFYDMFYT